MSRSARPGDSLRFEREEGIPVAAAILPNEPDGYPGPAAASYQTMKSLFR